jgi:ABC-type multidrug transport system fused ATPase/permease subunit
MRELLYDGYLRFPRAFYDRHPTGQVVSRATNDLYPIRYFIGWGMVQGAQSVMMIVGAGSSSLSSIRCSRSTRRCRCRRSASSPGCSRTR